MVYFDHMNLYVIFSPPALSVLVLMAAGMYLCIQTFELLMTFKESIFFYFNFYRFLFFICPVTRELPYTRSAFRNHTVLKDDEEHGSVSKPKN